MGLRTLKLTLSTFSNTSNFTAGNETDALRSEGPYQAAEMVIIVLVTGSISLVTITGSILVMLSITLNRNLQTINNYFLCSLACSDLTVGVSSMNLYTVYIVLGYWPLGPVVCDLWLALDYMVNNASALNLLIISFDRYFCITKPLSYPARRTARIAGMMIAAAWVIAFLLWAPAILFWQYIVGERTVPEGECYVQFLSDPTISFIITVVSFYVPVAIMGFLYWQISRASKSRMKTDKSEPKQNHPSCREAGSKITMPRADNDVITHCGGTSGVKEPSAPVLREGNDIVEAPASHKGNPTAHRLNGTLAKQRPKKKASPSRETRVTRTVMALLAAFIVVVMPFNLMILINTFCSTCVPPSMWTFSYWLCYCNSTINPACYALCNATFKKTFKQLLLCQHKDIRSGK